MLSVGEMASRTTWKGSVVVLPARSLAVTVSVALMVSLASKA
jgi:hypothetical protein